MNPYETPRQISEPIQEKLDIPRGSPCLACGSTNTSTDDFLRLRPNLLYVIFFGWLFLLVRTAFAMQTCYCKDCGAEIRYKSMGSRMAMALLIVLCFLVLLIALGS